MRSFSMLAGARAAIGFMQGAAGWVLYEAAKAHAWPATEPYLFAALVFGISYVPVLAVLGLGNVRPIALAAWLGGALGAVVIVGLHEVARSPAPAMFDPRPEVASVLVLAGCIGQALVAAGDADRRPIAAYATYFDAAWKLAVQLALAALFLGLFWAVLGLGAELFHIIGLDFLRKTIEKAGFAMPASGLAVACALHVSDVRVGLVQGMRNLLHVLLSWLLPVAVVLIVGFIASLPFTGLGPLWRTSHGAEIVLTAAAVLVVLINTAYRDGDGSPHPAVLRWAGSAAALCLPLLVAISAYGLALRVGQRGWSEYRIIAAASPIIAACYAAGYAWAAIASRQWLKRLEVTNIVTACVILAAIIALTTAIADPARLSVHDQVARLESGRVGPEQFDFLYLRFHSARYGREALARLKKAPGPKAVAIRRRAEAALAMTAPHSLAPPAQLADLMAIPVFPPGQSLPQSLLRQNWQAEERGYLLPQCLLFASAKCEAYVTAGAAGGPIIIFSDLGKYATGGADACDSPDLPVNPPTTSAWR